MNIFFRASMPRFSLLLAPFLLSALPAHAQQSTGQAGPYQFKADRITTPGGIANGSWKLEGNVRLYTPDPKASPQLDLAAALITAESRLRRIRGQGGVSLKYSGVRPSVTPNDPGVPVNVQAGAQEVLLDSDTQDGRRTITLLGNLSGFYQIGVDRTELKGQKAVISFGARPNDVKATFEGGAQGFDLTLPPQDLGSQLPLGRLTLHGGGRALLDQAANTARLEGGASLSSEGPGKLSISGGAFDASFVTKTARVQDKDVTTRSLSRLSSSGGRVSISLILPPKDIGAPAQGTQDATYPLSASSAVLRLVPQATPAPTTATVSKPAVPQSQAQGKAPADAAITTKKQDTTQVPVRIEFSADSIVIEPQTQPLTPGAKPESRLTLTLKGNVRGSYVLREVLASSRPTDTTSASNPTPPANQNAANPDKQPLSLDMDIEGAQIELPGSFGFSL